MLLEKERKSGAGVAIRDLGCFFGIAIKDGERCLAQCFP